MSNPFVYQSVFGGANVYPSDISYSSITLGANIALNWPLESSPGLDNYATRIMDVTATGSGYVITLPDATGAGVGETILFNNIGTNTFTISNGTIQVATVESGKSIQIYLADNSTIAGLWRAIPYGVDVSSPQTAVLAGYGLKADGRALDTAVDVTAIDVSAAIPVNLRSRLINWVGTAGTLTLPDPSLVGANWYCWFRNQGAANGAGQLTISSSTTATIDGITATAPLKSTKTLRPSESCQIITDGVNWFSVAYGQNAVFVFDYDALPPVFGGTLILAGTDLNRIAYGFTGLLSSDQTIVVPTTKQQYWVYNGTTGPYNFYVKTATQAAPGVQVVQNNRTILYCNGTNVVKANDNNVPSPIPIVEGGTGATTATGALINLGAGNPTGLALFQSNTSTQGLTALGGTVIGRGVFTAPTQAAAQTILGITDLTEQVLPLILALG